MADKILFVGNTAWSLFNFRLGVMLFLKEHGYEIVTVAPYDEYAEKLKDAGIEFYPLQKLNAKGINPWNEYLLVREFKSLYKKIRPSIIFHYTIKPNIYGVRAADKLGIPSVAITTGLGYVFSSRNMVSYVAKTLYKKTLCKAKEVWFLNQDDLKSFLDERIIEKNRTFLLPGEGVNTSVFSPVDKPEHEQAGKLRFIFTGRMLYDKGVGEFVEATRILKNKGYDFESVLLGFMDVLNPAAISQKVMKSWQDEGLVEYLGATADVRPYLHAADCLVLPSSYREGVPRSLLEAASMEMPIITTNNVGCRDVVDDGLNGYICEMKNAVSLAESMERFIKLSVDERRVMGQNGRRKVLEKFDEKVIFDIYLNKVRHYLA